MIVFKKLQDYVIRIFSEERIIEMCLFCLLLPLFGLIVIIYHTIGYFRDCGFNK